MALKAKHGNQEFGVGDVVAVYQKLADRVQIFEGMVIGIKGRGQGKSFTVRRVGAQNIGIERIFPLVSPVIEKIELKKRGKEGIKHAKLFYTRDKSKKEIEKIFSRAAKRIKKE